MRFVKCTYVISKCVQQDQSAAETASEAAHETAPSGAVRSWFTLFH